MRGCDSQPGQKFGKVMGIPNSGNALILAASRVSYAMGSERLLSDWLNQTDARFGTPSRAIVATGLGIVASITLRIRINLLAEVAGFKYLLTYGLVYVTVILLLRGNEDYYPKFLLPEVRYPPVPVLDILATGVTMT